LKSDKRYRIALFTRLQRQVSLIIRSLIIIRDVCGSNKEDAPPEMINANDHVASEEPGRFSTCIELRDLSSSTMDAATVACHGRPRCDRLALARNYTTRLCHGTIASLAKNVTRVATTSNTKDELAMEEEQLALSRPAFSDHWDKKSLKGSWIEDEGYESPPRSLPPKRHKGAYYTPVYSRWCASGRCTRR